MTTVIVMAKECVPGRVKTRLHPPLSLEEAAGVAQACLDDTIEKVRRVPAHRLLCVQGEVPPTEGFDRVAQGEGGLDERIAAVIDRTDGAVLLIGMDTPQLDPALLRDLALDWPDDVDAWFGPALDGGFWLLGLAGSDRMPAARGDLVRGVPMSRADTGEITRRRLVEAGLRVRDVDALQDIDDIDSLRAVADAVAPGSRLYGGWRSLAGEVS